MTRTSADVGFLLLQASRAFTQRFERLALGLGLSGRQAEALLYLQKYDGTHQSELASLTDIEPMSLGRAVDGLQTAGYVERRPDRADRRVRRLFVTPLGHQLLASTHERLEELDTAARAGIRPEEIAQFSRTLTRMLDALSRTSPAESQKFPTF
jgi:DNA-binding MarR family transcriptional regulator